MNFFPSSSNPYIYFSLQLIRVYRNQKVRFEILSQGGRALILSPDMTGRSLLAHE